MKRIEVGPKTIPLSSVLCPGALDSIVFLTHHRGFGVPAYAGSSMRFSGSDPLPVPRGARFLVVDEAGRKERIRIAPEYRMGSRFGPSDFVQAVKEQSSLLDAELQNEHLFLRTRTGGPDARFGLRDEWGQPLESLGFRSTSARGSQTVRLALRPPSTVAVPGLRFLILASRAAGSTSLLGETVPLAADELFAETSSAALRGSYEFHGALDDEGQAVFQVPQALFPRVGFQGTLRLCCLLVDSSQEALFASNGFLLSFP